MKKLILILALAFAIPAVSACHPPATIQTEHGKAAYRADEVVKRIGYFQNAVIDASQENKILLVDARAIATWISGDIHTNPPIIGVVDLIEKTPQGWKATVLAGWNGINGATGIRARVLLYPALASWVPTIDQLLAGLE